MDMVKEELADVMNKSSEKAEQAYVGDHAVDPSEEDADRAQSLASRAFKEEREQEDSKEKKEPTRRPIASLMEKVFHTQRKTADDYDDREQE